ncbi:MAG: ATP synthase F1 subunit gamma [Deltaproteobacteria bacterium]|nr:ATP synthase F1 subunit gamma [Deltaproteobacteria bacterium]
MATLKEVQIKISAVKKTKQITKAMNMVATSKLRGAQQKVEAFRPYTLKFADVLGSLAEKAGEEANPLLVPRGEVKKIQVVLCSSDKGLCGGFNSHLISMAEKFVKEKSGQNIDVVFTNFGKKGRDWCRRNGFSILAEHLGIVGAKFGFNIATVAGQRVVDGFLDEEYDEVYIIYSEFISMAKQIPVIQQILPIQPVESAGKNADMLPRHIYVQLYSALLETSTSEHAARMTAMNNATKACDDMVDTLSLAYNKARQSSITADLMDIVGGAEALKG